MTHTPRPLRVDQVAEREGDFQDTIWRSVLVDENDEPVAWDGGYNNADDMGRLAACWNACLGISTEALESGVVQEMLGALKKATRFVVNSPERDAARVYFEMFAAIAKAKGQQPPDTSTTKGE